MRHPFKLLPIKKVRVSKRNDNNKKRNDSNKKRNDANDNVSSENDWNKNGLPWNNKWKNNDDNIRTMIYHPIDTIITITIIMGKAVKVGRIIPCKNPEC